MTGVSSRRCRLICPTTCYLYFQNFVLKAVWIHNCVYFWTICPKTCFNCLYLNYSQTINNSCLDLLCGNSVVFQLFVSSHFITVPFISSFSAAYRGVLNSPVKAVRDSLINQCAQILACYRKNCASPSSAGQVSCDALTWIMDSDTKKCFLADSLLIFPTQKNRKGEGNYKWNYGWEWLVGQFSEAQKALPAPVMLLLQVHIIYSLSVFYSHICTTLLVHSSLVLLGTSLLSKRAEHLLYACVL